MKRMENIKVRIIKYSIIVSIGILITPYLVMIAGFIILFAGFFSTSPSFNLRKFKSNKMIRENEIESDKMEDPDRIYNLPWKKIVFKMSLGIFLSVLSLILLSLGWKGIIFYF